MKNWQEFYGNEGVWQNSLHPEDSGEEPTVSIVITYHETAILERGAYYSYLLRHVRGFHGKGFMATRIFNFNGERDGNSRVFYGTDEATEDEAKQAGREMVAEADKSYKDMIAKIEGIQDSKREDQTENQVKKVKWGIKWGTH